MNSVVQCSLPLQFPHGMETSLSSPQARLLQAASSLDSNIVHLWMVGTDEVRKIGEEHEAVLRYQEEYCSAHLTISKVSTEP